MQGLTLFSAGHLATTDAGGWWDLISSRAPGQYPERSDVHVAAALPEGRYALVVSMVDAEDPLALYGDQQVVIFDVEAHPSAPPAVLPPAPPEPPEVGTVPPVTPASRRRPRPRCPPPRPADHRRPRWNRTSGASPG